MNRPSRSQLLPATALGVALLLSSVLDAQERRRPLSPKGSSATQVGGVHGVREGYEHGKWIEIFYGRPIKRGRDLFGPPDFIPFLNDGAPVWRAGANYTTTLVTEVPLEIAGTKVDAGEYTVFIQLGPEEWIFILSNWPAQKTYDYSNKEALFGAYGYLRQKDVVRTTMKLEELPYSRDQLSWEFLDMSDKGGRLAIFWDRKMASVEFLVAED